MPVDDRLADQRALDGNAIGGLLREVFGGEMTAVAGTCAGCGAVAPVADGVVYLATPGTVMRCRSCGAVLLVIVRHHQQNCVDLQGLSMLETPHAPIGRS